MKKITLILCGLFLFAGAIFAQVETKKNEAEITFTVSVHCNNCKKKIENSLPHEKGVKDLKVSVKEQTVWMKYDSDKTNKDLLRKAIEKLGYAVSEKITDEKAAKTSETTTKADTKQKSTSNK